MRSALGSSLLAVLLSSLPLSLEGAAEAKLPSATARLSIPALPAATGTVEAVLDNPTDQEQTLDLRLSVVDFFQKPVLAVTRSLNVPPGKTTVALGAFPALDAKRFRADFGWRFGVADWQESQVYAEGDFVDSGPRRMQRLDGGPWQRLVPAQAPRDGPAYPPQGTWETTPFPLKPAWSEASHWTWFRQDIPVQPWLDGAAVTLRLAQADYNSRVYLNGHKLGEHLVALTPFSYALSGFWKPGEVNVLEMAVGDMSTTYADVAKDRSFNMITPSVGTGGVPGLWEGVYLISHSSVYVEDVFAMPSVQRRALTVRTWLVNSGAASAPASLRYAAEDEGRQVWSTLAETVVLQPGERRMLETVIPWRKPELWWPQAPHLYRLRAQLAVADALQDEVSVRFGFREVRIAGTNLLLNGRIFRPFGFTSAGEGPGIRQPNREIFEWWWNRKKMDRPWLMRLHVQVRPGWYAEVADEMGVCLEPETSFLSTVFYDFTDPRFWQNTLRHATDLVARDRNSPSVIYWSAGNEVILAAGASKTPLKDYLGNCKRVIAAMKEADPTRPVIYEGGMDETAEMIDLHYPRDWYRHTDFPNAAFWLKPGVMTESDNGQTPVFPWRGDRPVTIGEEGQLFTAQPPHDMATFMGDGAYLEPLGYAASARLKELDDLLGAAYLEGYRRSGVVRISPDCGASGGPRMSAAMKLVRTFVQPRDECFFANSTVEREISVFHDALVAEKLTLTWRVRRAATEAAATVAHGSTSLRLAAGEVRHVPISWKTPKVEASGRYVLETRLANAQGEVFAEQHEYAVYPAPALRVPAGASVGLYDPDGRTAATLARLGAGTLKRVETLSPEALAGLSGLILAEALPAEPDRAPEALGALTAAGGKVILLRQLEQAGLKWLPIKGLGRAEGIRHTTCFARDYAHPLLAGIDDSLLRLWGSDHVVAVDSFPKITSGKVIPIIDAGGPRGSGLCYAPMAEIVLPRGSWVLCQLRLVEKAATHPGARRLLQNILDYAAAPSYRTARPLGVLAGDGSVVRRLLRDLDVETLDVAAGGLERVGAIIVDEQGVQGRAPELRTFAAQGGIVLVKGLTPETRDRFSGLFAAPPELVADEQTKRPVQDCRDPLISAISNEELYWERRKEQFARAPAKCVGTSVYRYLIAPGSAAISLYRTEVRDGDDQVVPSRGSGLVKTPVAKGWIVVDQTRWEAAYEPQPQVWGNTTPFAAGLQRYVSLLLANLEARREPGAAE
jgi:hypothetical protein